MGKQSAHPTTFRKNARDEAMIAALQAQLGGIPLSNLLRMGLELLMKKHGLKLPEPKKG